MDELLLQRDMTAEQRLMFQSEMSRVRKDPTVALLLCLFLGGLGAHQFYLGKIGLGILYILFVWTFIPLIVSLVELFLIMERTRRYNDAKALEIAAGVRLLTASTSSSAAQDSAFCTKCGANVGRNAQFCSACGTPLTQPTMRASS